MSVMFGHVRSAWNNFTLATVISTLLSYIMKDAVGVIAVSVLLLLSVLVSMTPTGIVAFILSCSQCALLAFIRIKKSSAENSVLIPWLLLNGALTFALLFLLYNESPTVISNPLSIYGFCLWPVLWYCIADLRVEDAREQQQQ